MWWKVAIGIGVLWWLARPSSAAALEGESSTLDGAPVGTCPPGWTFNPATGNCGGGGSVGYVDPNTGNAITQPDTSGPVTSPHQLDSPLTELTL